VPRRPTRAEIEDATNRMAEGDPTMARLVRAHGLPTLDTRRSGESAFTDMAEAIAYQQLAGKAAAAIWGRVRGLIDGAFTPEAVLALGPDALRSAGFSGSKTASLLDLATKVAGGVVRLDRLGHMRDEEVVEHLTVVRGIGRWTAQMHMIFTMQRLDVWPTGDLGVRVGYARAFGMADAPSAKALEPLGERFRPYRTITAWYCWRAASQSPP
jgi:DNA-3-methyladenine glycosylase II